MLNIISEESGGSNQHRVINELSAKDGMVIGSWDQDSFA